MSNLKLNSIFKTVCIASDHAGFNLKEDINTNNYDCIYVLTNHKIFRKKLKNLNTKYLFKDI